MSISDEIIDKWINILSVNQLKILLIVLRRTWDCPQKGINIPEILRHISIKGKFPVRDALNSLQDYRLINQIRTSKPITKMEDAYYTINIKLGEKK